MARSASAPPGEAVNGVLNINKPAGITSHDVVSRVRKLSHQRRVGHAGTLDPMATGVLLVCLGPATRISEYLVDGTKAYRATVCLGQETNTWDAEGEITATVALPALDLAQIEAACEPLRGEIVQVPPMFSAIKQGGRPLYELARQGIEVKRMARPVQIYELTVVDWSPPLLTLDVVCSKGTYIRSLAHDLGQTLGLGAHLAGLVRTRVGCFSLEGATPLEELEADDSWEDALYTMADALAHLEKVSVDEEARLRLRHGQCISIAQGGSGLMRAVDDNGALVAILAPAEEDGWWRPNKVLQAL